MGTPLKEKFKRFWFDLKIFLIYLFTEPFIQIWKTFKSLWTRTETLNRTKTWRSILFAGTLVSFVLRERLGYMVFNIFAILLIFALLKYEWDSGTFRRKHTEKIRRRVIKNGLDQFNK